jgi:hypothetical protein
VPGGGGYGCSASRVLISGVLHGQVTTGLFTVAEVAALLNVCQGTIYGLVRIRRIPLVPLAGSCVSPASNLGRSVGDNVPLLRCLNPGHSAYTGRGRRGSPRAHSSAGRSQAPRSAAAL